MPRRGIVAVIGSGGPPEGGPMALRATADRRHPTQTASPAFFEPRARLEKRGNRMRAGLFFAVLVRQSVVVLLCGLLSSAAWAQQTASGIAGTVRDASGAVLPGVTVEAASPALIEK